MAQVLRKLRRLAWAENEAYVVRCMLAAAKGRFDDLPLVASLAAGLSRYHPSLAVALPDALLEEARSSCECFDVSPPRVAWICSERDLQCCTWCLAEVYAGAYVGCLNATIESSQVSCVDQ